MWEDSLPPARLCHDLLGQTCRLSDFCTHARLCMQRAIRVPAWPSDVWETVPFACRT